MSAAGRVLSAGVRGAGSNQREEVAAVEPMEELGTEPARRPEPALPGEPAGVQSLPPQGKSGKALGLPLRRGYGQLSGEVDGSTALAAIALLSETRQDVDPAPQRHFELLPDQGALRSGRGYQR